MVNRTYCSCGGLGFSSKHPYQVASNCNSSFSSANALSPPCGAHKLTPADSYTYQIHTYTIRKPSNQPTKTIFRKTAYLGPGGIHSSSHWFSGLVPSTHSAPVQLLPFPFICICAHMSRLKRTCGGQRTTCRSHFSFHHGDLSIELRPSGLAASPYSPSPVHPSRWPLHSIAH